MVGIAEPKKEEEVRGLLTNGLEGSLDSELVVDGIEDPVVWEVAVGVAAVEVEERGILALEVREDVVPCKAGFDSEDLSGVIPRKKKKEKSSSRKEALQRRTTGKLTGERGGRRGEGARRQQRRLRQQCILT